MMKINKPSSKHSILQIIVLLFSLLGNLRSFSQQVPFTFGAQFLSPNSINSSRFLDIGDQCPDFELNNIIRYKKKTARISDFKGKLLVLDFWTTGCGPCYSAMPKNDLLQKKVGENLVIMPVGMVMDVKDKSMVKEITDFWNNNKWTKNVSLPTAITNPYIYNRFTSNVSNGVPFMVWINGDGIIVGITKGLEYLNENEVNALIKKEKAFLPDMRWRGDFDYTKSVSSQLSIIGISTSSVDYTITTGYIDNLSPRTSLLFTDSNLIYSAINIPAIGIVAVLLNELERQSNECINPHPQINKNDSAKFYHLGSIYGGIEYDRPQYGIIVETNLRYGYHYEWQKKNSLCFETIVPLKNTSKEQAVIRALENFIAASNIKIEKKKQEVVLINITGRLNKEKTIEKFKPLENDLEVEYANLIDLRMDFNNLNKNAKMVKSSNESTTFDSPLKFPQSYMKDPKLFQKVLDTYGFQYTYSAGTMYYYFVTEKLVTN